jgi:hypothetical protein
MLLLFGLSGISASAQECEIPKEITCTINKPNSFTVIETSKTFSQMIADGELLPQNNNGTPQYLIVCQTITNDLPGTYSFASGSEIVFLNSNSGLNVNGGSHVRFLTSSYLHGCERLWKGTRVFDGGRLDFSNCVIEDALTAVHIEPNGQFNSVGSIFSGNFSCIYAGAAGSPNQHSITTILEGNTFSGQKPLLSNVIPNPLLPNCFFSKPMYGIEVENVRFMSVGGVNPNNPNRFTDFSNSWSCTVFTTEVPTGIRIRNSNVRVSGSLFNNIASSGEGRGVQFTVSPGSPSTLTLTGLGKNGPNTFTNVATGVYGLGNMTIQESRFESLIWCVYLSGIPAPYNVNILNNSFNQVSDHTIFADQASPIQGITVKYNDFTDNSTFSGGIFGLPRSGVYITSFTPGQQTSWIYSNNFTNSLKTGSFSYGNRGVWIRNLNGSLIEQNDFKDFFSTTGQSYEGVSVFNGTSRIWSNTFTGPGNWTQHPSTGIQILESRACWINCNTANQTKVGWEFRGTNCDGASLQKNNLNTHDIGLLLRADAIIGPQNNLYNRWIGTGSNIEARFEGRSPTVITDVTFVQQSKFRIHTPNMATDFWPSPVLFGTVNDPGLWFQSGQPANILCIATDPGGGGNLTNTGSEKTEADTRVLSGTYQPIKGYPAGQWEAAVRLFDRLTTNPELRPVGSEDDTWYTAQQNTSVGKLSTVYQGIIGLSTYSPTEQNLLSIAEESHKAAITNLSNKDVEISAVASDVNAVIPQLEQHLEERQALEATLAVATADYQNTLNSIRTNRLLAAQQLLGTLTDISTSEPYETDYKTVCQILLGAYITGSTPNENDLNTLRTIAEQCRYEGGLAVLQARASLSNDTDWDPYDTCPEVSERSADSKASLNEVSLYPNPAHQAAFLDLGYPVGTGVQYYWT